MRNKLKILFFFLITISIPAQVNLESKSIKGKIKIPFELTHNLIIVDIVLNGKPLKMIADTGADKSLLFSIPQNDSLILNKAERINIKGVGSEEKIEAFLTTNNHLKINKFEEYDFELVLLPNQDISIIDKLGIPINGILGNSFFKKGIIEINYQKKQLILHPQKLLINDKRIKKYQKLPVEVTEDKPYITVPIAVDKQLKKYKLLFDTGLGDGLWLFENDTLQCNNIFFEDVLGVGLSGNISGKRSRIQHILFSGFNLNQALVSYPDSTSFNQNYLLKSRNGSLGGEITKRFNWFLDFENQAFYFKKNNLFNLPFEYNMSGIEVQHSGSEWDKVEIRDNSSKNSTNLNEFFFDDSSKKFNYDYKLKPVFHIYAIRKNSPADRAGLQVNDKIVSINNRVAAQLTIQSISNLFQSEAGKYIYIIVERNKKQIAVKFQLEKIL